MLSPKKVKVKKQIKKIKTKKNKIENIQGLIDDGKVIYQKSDVISLPPIPVNDSTDNNKIDYNKIGFKNSVIDKLKG